MVTEGPGPVCARSGARARLSEVAASVGRMLTDDQIERVLVVTAHPDDVDFGAAGTVASLTARGVAVTYCICTDGDAGGFDPAVPRSEIGGIRRAEQTAAAKVLGVDDLVWLGYPDGALVATLELRRAIAEVIRRVKPQVVITQSPDRNHVRIPASHPDHREAGAAALDAIYPDARNPYAPNMIDLTSEPWSVLEIWVQGREVSNKWVDMTDSFDLKLDALLCHASQMSVPREALAERMRGWFSLTAKEGGLPAGRMAEAFWVTEIPF